MNSDFLIIDRRLSTINKHVEALQKAGKTQREIEEFIDRKINEMRVNHEKI